MNKGGRQHKERKDQSPLRGGEKGKGTLLLWALREERGKRKGEDKLTVKVMDAASVLQLQRRHLENDINCFKYNPYIKSNRMSRSLSVCMNHRISLTT